MVTDLLPPPEAQLIAEMREKPPRMSMREAARAARISDARWRQIEHGVRYFRGIPYPEIGPAQTIARMAHAVGVTAAQLTEAGRADAAAELEAMAESAEHAPPFTGAQRRALAGSSPASSSSVANPGGAVRAGARLADRARLAGSGGRGSGRDLQRAAAQSSGGRASCGSLAVLLTRHTRLVAATPKPTRRSPLSK